MTPGDDDRREWSHAERLEWFARLSGLERQGDATMIRVDERGKATERRLDALDLTVREHRKQCESDAEQSREDLTTAKTELLAAIVKLERTIEKRGEERRTSRGLIIVAAIAATATVIAALISAGVFS